MEVVDQAGVITKQLVIRPIVRPDAATLADLHIASWRSAYRGLLRDQYLDTGLVSDRQTMWGELMRNAAPSHFGFIAEADRTPVGFVFLRGAHDRVWGTLLDNLHVLPELRGQGLGRMLVAAAARETMRRYAGERVHLWVFEPNVDARRFYSRLGGDYVERAVVEAPGGGTIAEWRVVWDNPDQLLRATAERGGATDGPS